MVTNLPAGVALATFLNAPLFANERKKAVNDLSVP
jgi:hypothetical protein